MHWSKCFKHNCLIHEAESKQFEPSPKYYQQPNWRQQLAATEHGFHLNLEARILGQLTKVMVDSGATGNFMNPRFQQELGILGIEKPEARPIAGLNGENLGTHIKTESGYVHMAVMGHNERINFNMTPLGQYDVVLGIPWLRNHNPVIDWKHKQIEFTNCTCPKTDRLEEWDSGTLLQLTGGTEDYAKRLRGGLKMIRRIPSDRDAAMNMIIAAMKTSE